MNPVSVPLDASAEHTHPAVELRDVTASPARRAPLVLHGVNLTLEAGSTTGLMGQNGSGKSTLCRVISGLVPPSRGVVLIHGQPLAPGRLARGAAMLFQSPRRSLSPRMTLAQSIAEPLILSNGGGSAGRRGRHKHTEAGRGQAGRAHIRAEVAHSAERVGLTPDLLSRRPAAVSDGQLQRAALARALIARPRVLLADEATASLDPATTASLVALLRDVARQGTAVLTVSHDADLLAAWCAGPTDRVISLPSLQGGSGV